MYVERSGRRPRTSYILGFAKCWKSIAYHVVARVRHKVDRQVLPGRADLLVSVGTEVLFFRSGVGSFTFSASVRL